MTVVTQLPTPVPSTSDPSNFDTRADNFLGALPTFVSELNAVANEVNAYSSSASASASSASSSSATAVAAANFKGTWASLGTGSVTRPACVAHNGKFWILLVASIANASTSQPGVSGDWQAINSPIYYTYANRNNLRSTSPTLGDMCMIEGIGIFVWQSGSTEIDDDETCFATASGRWLLYGTSPEYVTMRLKTVEDVVSSLLSAKSPTILLGRKAWTLTSVTAASAVSTTIPVSGAIPGDYASVSPPNALHPSLSIFAVVTSLNNVTVYVNNPTAVDVTGLTSGTWNALVIRN